MTGSHLPRRSFLKGTLLGAAAMGVGRLPSRAFAQDVTGAPGPGEIGDFQISLAEWSLHKRLFEDRARTAELNLEFPRMAREEFGIDAVEYVNQFFYEQARDEAYLNELKKRAADQGVTNVLIMIDREPDISAADRAERQRAVDGHKKWVDAAAHLGCKAIRINTGNNYSATDTDAAADGCRSLAEYARTHDINIICENHGGPSSNPDALLALVRAVDMPNFGTLPDFGNFPSEGQGEAKRYAIDVYDAIARLMPYAKGVSAKSYDFNEDGTEKYLDFARILKIVTDAGYHGHVGIEYEGGRLSEAEGIKATKSLLESLRGSTYQPA